MNDSYDDSENRADGAPPYENLPPVEPPSAGFIVQLFVVPALIVMVVVGVWALFGKLAAGEQDWRSLVAELRHENEHRRWRGALGLAQLLNADEQRGTSSERLAQNPEIARELAEMLQEQLKKSAPQDDDLKHQAYLALTLGNLDVPSAVLPALRKAMSPEHDREVRKNAIAAVALIAGRLAERGEKLSDADTVSGLVEASQDSDPLVRQLAAYALGLTPSEESQQRLAVLLADSDENTRLNAAVALARQHSTQGLPVFEEVLKHAAGSGNAANAAADPHVFEELVSLKNVLKAVGDLSGTLSAEEKGRLRTLIAPIAEGHREPKIRLDAQQTLTALESQAA